MPESNKRSCCGCDCRCRCGYFVGTVVGTAAGVVWMHHHVCAADFDNVLKLNLLGLEGMLELLQRRQQLCGDLCSNGDVHGRGIGTVRGLRHVDMVVWVDSFGSESSTHHFDCTVGDDLVYIHIALCA